MKRTFTLMFGLGFVLYLSSTALAQGKVAGHAPQPANRDVDNNKTLGKADAREDGKEADYVYRIQQNPALTQKLQDLLPKTGPNSTLAGAASGFRNEGHFISALHASKNLGIPFDSLKTKMMGPPSMSLGHAIHALKPNLSEKDVDKEADKAEK